MTPCASKPKASPSISIRLFDPGHPLEKILHSWGAQRIKCLSSVPIEMTYAPLERMVLLTGTLKGTLVVRSTLEFASWLRNLHTDGSLGRYNEVEVFEEWVSLYCLYLFHDFWTPRDFHIRPIRPFRSIPSDWPLGEPHAACVYSVENLPVEIRLWMKD